jgi:alpha-L-arabinofuranosidase
MNGDATHAGYLEFRTAMRAIDPTIEVGAVGIPHPTEWNAWGNEVLVAGGTEMDFYSLHEYAFDTSPAFPAILSNPQPNWDGIRTDLDIAIETHANGRDVAMAVTEYNLISVGDNDTGAAMTRAVNALFIADTLGQLVEKGFFLANHWDMANGAFPNGTDYGLVHADTFSRYPQYYVFPLWTRFGGQMLSSNNNLPATTLSVYAGRVDGDTVSLIAINKTGQPLTADITVTGSSVTGGTADTLQATDLSATTVTYNGNTNPADDLSDAPSTPLTVSSETIAYEFPSYSVTLLRLNTSGGPAPFSFRQFLPNLWGRE